MIYFKENLIEFVIIMYILTNFILKSFTFEK